MNAFLFSCLFGLLGCNFSEKNRAKSSQDEAHFQLAPEVSPSAKKNLLAKLHTKESCSCCKLCSCSVNNESEALRIEELEQLEPQCDSNTLCGPGGAFQEKCLDQ